ncbi:hypothetical protein ACFL4U_01275 [Candidatus Neomarinimicrobiota bacterium]
MSSPFLKFDEREKSILYKVSAVMYFITVYALIAVLLYRQFILGQSINEHHDIAIIVTFNALGFVSLLFYLSGVSFKKLKPLTILGIYLGLVAVGTVFNIITKPLRSLGAIVDNILIIAPISAGIIGLYVLFAYAGKRKIDKEM